MINETKHFILTHLEGKDCCGQIFNCNITNGAKIQIKNVDGKIANSKIQYAGFSGEIKNLSVKSESENFRIQISEMNIVLPKLFSSSEKIKVDFENVYYDSKSKKFNCDLKLKELKFSVCDFTLKCSDIFLNTTLEVSAPAFSKA